MNILIKTQTTQFFEATCENTSAFVAKYSTGYNICCLNASATKRHQHVPVGKMFISFEKALDTYHSSEMKAIIQAAAQHFEPPTPLSTSANTIPFQSI